MPRRLPALLVAVTLAACVGACGSSGSSAGPPRVGRGAGPGVGSARCAANRAAGPITYLTGFGYQASVGILDVAAAAAEGLYRAECLDVRIQPGNGDAGSAAQLAAAGRATLVELGSPSDAITAQAHGVDVDAVATYGNVPSITLLTSPSITELPQLEGRTLGYKGAMPPQVTAMLSRAGVDVRRVREVGVGFDPTILARGQVAALTAYKSNEPVELRARGVAFREWDPDRFGIRGSFNVLDVNRAFARAHPSAVEDFLRATFRAFSGCVAAVGPCIDDAATLQAGYDKAQNTQEWKLQAGLVERSLLPGRGVGAESIAQWTPEAQLLFADGMVSHHPDLTAMVDPHYVAAIEQGGRVVWPAP